MLLEKKNQQQTTARNSQHMKPVVRKSNRAKPKMT